MSTTSTLRYTSSRERNAAVGIARVAAAGRVRREREARERAYALQREITDTTGQHLALDGDDWDVDYCFICGRVTDHLGEHSDEQVEAWKAGRS